MTGGELKFLLSVGSNSSPNIQMPDITLFWLDIYRSETPGAVELSQVLDSSSCLRCWTVSEILSVPLISLFSLDYLRICIYRINQFNGYFSEIMCVIEPEIYLYIELRVTVDEVITCKIYLLFRLLST